MFDVKFSVNKQCSAVNRGQILGYFKDDSCAINVDVTGFGLTVTPSVHNIQPSH